MIIFKRLLLFFVAFFLVWRIKIFGYIDVTVFLLPFIVFLFPRISGDSSNRLNNATIFGILILMIMLMYVLFMYIMNEACGSSFYVLKYFRVLISFVVSAAMLRYLIVFHKVKMDDLINIIGFVLLIHPLSMMIQLLSLEAYSLMLDILGSEGYFHRFRLRGLMNGSSSGGQLLGYFSGYFLFLALYFRSRSWLWLYYSIAVLFPVSALAGFVPYILFGLLGLFYSYKFMLKQLLIFLSMLFLFLSLIVFIDYEIISSVVSIAKGRLGVFFGIEGNVSQGNPIVSFNKLLSSMNSPTGTYQLLFGNLQPSKSYFSTTDSDSGYISNLHGIGIFGTLLMIMSVFAFVFKSGSRFLAIFFLSWLVVLIKNDMSYGRIVFDYFFLIYFLSYIYKNNLKLSVGRL